MINYDPTLICTIFQFVVIVLFLAITSRSCQYQSYLALLGVGLLKAILIFFSLGSF